MNNQINLPDYREQFKIMLVRRYQWTVTKASEYDSPDLDEAFESGLTIRDAYCKIFNVPPDEQSDGDGKIGSCD